MTVLTSSAGWLAFVMLRVINVLVSGCICVCTGLFEVTIKTVVAVVASHRCVRYVFVRARARVHLLDSAFS